MQKKTFAPAISIWVLVMVLNNNYVDYKLTNFALIRVIIQIAMHRFAMVFLCIDLQWYFYLYILSK